MTQVLLVRRAKVPFGQNLTQVPLIAEFVGIKANWLTGVVHLVTHCCVDWSIYGKLGEVH